MRRRLIAVLGATAATVVVLVAAPRSAHADDSGAARNLIEHPRASPWRIIAESHREPL